MLKSITLRAFPPEMNTLSRIELARDAGFDGIEINLENGEEFSLESKEEEILYLRRRIDALGLKVSSVYCRQQWLFPLSSQKHHIRRKCQDIIENLILAATILEADAVLVVPGGVDNSIFAPEPEIIPYDIAYQNAQGALVELAKIAQASRVFLAVENVWNKFLLSPLEFAGFIDEIDSPWVGVYFDVGNVLRTGFPEHWIPILAHRIKRIHFKDFRLSIDNIRGFVTLLEGDVNWPAVMGALREMGYSSWITAEVLPAYRYKGERLIFETSASMDAILAMG